MNKRITVLEKHALQPKSRLNLPEQIPLFINK